MTLSTAQGGAMQRLTAIVPAWRGSAVNDVMSRWTEAIQRWARCSRHGPRVILSR